MSKKMIASSFILISYIIYSLIFIVPFLHVSVRTKGLLVGILYFGSWIPFGFGLLMGGKEVVTYSKQINLNGK
jgi:hypothetical protein